MIANDQTDRLRRLRVLQALERASPDPMGEMAILHAVRVDPELSPTLERVRQSLTYLGMNGLVAGIKVPGSDWMAGRITEYGLAFLGRDGPDPELAIYHPSERPEPAPRSARGGRVSSVKTLPPEVKAWIDQELVRRQFTGYIDLAALLAEQGYEISKSALGRYGKKFKEEQQELKQSIEMAKAFAEVVGDDGAAMNQTLTALAQQELMAIIREGKYSDGIKLPALVRAIAQLNRSDINTRKFQIEQAARQKALSEAAETAEKTLTSQGMSRDTIATIKRDILGIA